MGSRADEFAIMWRYQPKADAEDLGNIWGWRFSTFGGVLIVTLLALAFALARHRGRPFLDHSADNAAEERLAPLPTIEPADRR